MAAAPVLDQDRVRAAYASLGSGDRAVIEQYWSPELTWETAGNSRVSGTYKGMDEFLGFLGTMGEISAGSLAMEFRTIVVDGDVAVAVTHNTATRANDADRGMDIEEVHFLRWRDGRIVQGRGAMFGTGTGDFEQFVA
ncbi:nuclear transport factor 2 family protein [Streptomyces sp. NPDC096205]|uniref:nuclear transport factor 2 family protein n=1 Tax=Streptomyces sp. NPDC096205 TaxID=3366081 RepID=UPI003823E526